MSISLVMQVAEHHHLDRLSGAPYVPCAVGLQM
jgi:hypothetical protein